MQHGGDRRGGLGGMRAVRWRAGQEMIRRGERDRVSVPRGRMPPRENEIGRSSRRAVNTSRTVDTIGTGDQGENSEGAVHPGLLPNGDGRGSDCDAVQLYHTLERADAPFWRDGGPRVFRLKNGSLAGLMLSILPQ